MFANKMFLLSKIDILGTPATLNFFGNEKKKSKFGGFCSLMYFGFLIWTICRSSIELISRDNPNIYVNDINVAEPKEIIISNKDFPIAFTVETPDSLGNRAFKNESIYTFELSYNILERVKQDDGTYIIQRTKTVIRTEECTREYFGAYVSEFDTFRFNGSYCISQNQPGLDQLKLQGLYTSTLYKYLVAEVTECDPITSNVTCGTSEETKKYLSGSWLNAIYLENAMTMDNFSHPTGKVRDTYSTLMNPSVYKEVTLNIGYLEVKTDSGWLTESIDTQTSFRMNKLTETVNLTPTTAKTLAKCIFQASRRETYADRTYKKIQTALAEVGGLANAALGILLILTTPYLRLKSREALMNDVFTVKLNSRSIKKTKNHPKKPNQQKDLANSPKRIEYRSNTSPNIFKEKKPKLESLTASFVSEGNIFKGLMSPHDIQENSKLDSTMRNALRQVSPSKSPFTSFRHFVTGNKDQVDRSPVKNISEQNQDEYSAQLTPKTQKLTIPPGDLFEEQDFEDNDDIILNFKNKKAGNLKVSNELKQIFRSKSFGNNTPKDDSREEKGEEIVVEGMDQQEQEGHEIWDGENHERDDDTSTKLKLQPWEYILSLVCKPKSLETKLDLLEEGIKTIDARLDVSSILKKFCEVDKVIALLLDRDQLELFNQLPKPVIEIGNDKIERQSTFADNLANKMMRVRLVRDEKRFDEAYRRIKCKENKTTMDKKLLDYFQQK